MTKSAIRILTVCFLVAAPLSTFANNPALHIDAANATRKVSPTLYGLMTEEINFSYDGGLYGELLRNRNFKGDWAHPAAGTLAHWSLAKADGAAATISLDNSSPLNDALPFALKLDASSLAPNQTASLMNDGYWGIPIRPGTTYKASISAKASADLKGPLTISLQSADGKTTFASAQIPALTSAWKTYDATLTTAADVTPTADARFVISTTSPGTLWLDFASLFPPTYNDRPNGLRPDIMQKLVDMKPSFLRFPGGNYLEGDTIDQRFDWKKTIGPIMQRPGHQSPWKYMSTDGLGLLEFLEWTEDMHAQSVLAVYAGYSLKGAHVIPGPALVPFVQDALDEIEYVTGDSSTKWGAQRIADGHPEPFPLHFVEIGNEDWFDRSGSYQGRFEQIATAIKAKYPDIKLIATTKVKSDKADLQDDHYYRSSGQMYDDAAHYDKYKRDGQKIFVGEWATREGSPTTNMNAALGDAAWMTGMERNSDVILISCYAPLFVNVNPGGMQWKSDLIGYDTLNSFGSPSYYVQKMFSTYIGDCVLPITAADAPTHEWKPAARRGGTAPPPKQVPSLFYVATRDTKTGMIYLKFVNTQDAPQNVDITLDGVKSVTPTGSAIVIQSENPTDTNSITEPTKIVPATSELTGLAPSFSHTFPAYSVSILAIPTQ